MKNSGERLKEITMKIEIGKFKWSIKEDNTFNIYKFSHMVSLSTTRSFTTKEIEPALRTQMLPFLTISEIREW